MESAYKPRRHIRSVGDGFIPEHSAGSTHSNDSLETSVKGLTIKDKLSSRERFRIFLLQLLKKLVMFISFGPGVLGTLWLIGRVFTRCLPGRIR